jgi:pentose-5-phosphate-3-epimerase
MTSQLRAVLNPIIVAPSILSADGGENRESARQAIKAGANAIVAGSAIFGSDDYAAAIAAIREAHYPLTGSPAGD